MSELIAVSAPTFTRPGDTTAYAAGDLVANSVTAASVVALVFNLPPRKLRIAGCRLRKSDGTDVANASFRLHLFSAVPTFATNGDNSAMSGNTTGAANYLMSLYIGNMVGLDDAVGDGIPASNNLWRDILPLQWDSGAAQTIYGVLEAMAAYAPASAETFTVTLFAVPDVD
jgi:hypothetical protein